MKPLMKTSEDVVSVDVAKELLQNKAWMLVLLQMWVRLVHRISQNKGEQILNVPPRKVIQNPPDKVFRFSMESSALVSFSFYSSFQGGTLAGAGAAASWRSFSRSRRRLRSLSFPFPSTVQPVVIWRRRFLSVVPVAAYGGRGSAGKRAYRQSQVQQGLPHIPVKEIASFVVPAGTFLAITFGHNFGDDGLFFLAESLAFNQSAEDVDFSGNGITAAGLKAFDGVLQANTVLKTLNLSGNAIGENNSCLQYLSDILMGNSGIQKLQLNSTGISDEELHLHGNNMGNEGVRALVSGLSSHRGKITLLDLGNNDIDPKGAFHVANYIKKTKSLLWLNLYMNDIGDELELGYNPIGPDGARALCDIIKFHGKLETLKLGWCQIGAKGVEYVADALKYNTTLSTLDLRANGLGDDGAICLARSLKIVNEALTSLDLGFNEIRDTGAFALAQALKANEDLAVTSLNLASNFLTKYGQVALTEARDHVYEMSEKEISIYF
ncbi:RAN GTPase-activating protein 1 [Dendrobium catenatum]|uniref:RAN GTPase-activating protein 1 n=1 Tax=Dendrobium catenatum TaxID=906689 RepID=A0A2I0VI81_9ASPA|nr:RAN GTPase-activating protein 1 [Dendrobium catenatum]